MPFLGRTRGDACRGNYNSASKRGIDELVGTFLGIPLSLGRLSNRQAELSAALASPHAEAHQAAVQNVDEIRWKQAGQKCWLWTAATTLKAIPIRDCP